MRELFRALELAHYAARFRERTFVIALADVSAFRELLLDIKVLLGYGIRLAFVLPDPDFSVERIIAESNKRGTRFRLSLLTDLVAQPGDPLGAFDFARLQAALAGGQTPVIAHHLDIPEAQREDTARALAGQVALRLGAHKLFLVAPELADLIRASARSHVVLHDIPALRAQVGAGDGAMLDFVSEMITQGIPDVVLLEPQAAALFHEVFTHDGAGLLFNQTRFAQIRQAQVRDVTDIMLLLRPEIDAGRILPTDENAIERDIRFYYVYEIDGVLVGLARLKVWGEQAEVAQFATLARYRGKGRAKELAQHLVDAARQQGFHGVFALSLDERMWDFFQELGFGEVPRETLPAAWAAQYDMHRPSRAFAKAIGQDAAGAAITKSTKDSAGDTP